MKFYFVLILARYLRWIILENKDCGIQITPVNIILLKGKRPEVPGLHYYNDR